MGRRQGMELFATLPLVRASGLWGGGGEGSLTSPPWVYLPLRFYGRPQIFPLLLGGERVFLLPLPRCLQPSYDEDGGAPVTACPVRGILTVSCQPRPSIFSLFSF